MSNGFTCPKCGADLSQDPIPIILDGWDDELLNGVVYIDLVCSECKSEFTNVYELKRQEVTFDGD